MIGRDGLIYLATKGVANASGHKLFCPFPDGRINWQFPRGNSARARPVLDRSGTVYVFTYGKKAGTLLSIRPDGTLNWRREFRSANWSEPFISQDGVIYVGLDGEELYALDKNGRLIWSTELGHGLFPGPPNIASDGTIYVCLSGTQFALHPDGKVKWQ